MESLFDEIKKEFEKCTSQPLSKAQLSLLEGYVLALIVDFIPKQLRENGRLLEALADLEHQQFSGLIKHQLKELSGDEWACAQKWTKWKKQSETSYSDLSEKEKASDRELARKVLAAFQNLVLGEGDKK